MSGSRDQDWKPKANPWLIAVVVTLAAFMEVLDTTIVNVSLPYIAGDLASSYDDSTWTLTSYLAANGVVLTISGWLSRTLGRKRVLPDLHRDVHGLLVPVRHLGQPARAHRLPPVPGFLRRRPAAEPAIDHPRHLPAQPAKRRLRPDRHRDRGRAGARPTVGGYLTFDYSWRWVFFINVPVGLFTTIMVARLIEDPPWAKKQKARLDVIGISLIAIGIGCLQVMADRGEDDDWFNSDFIRTLAVLGFVGIVGAVCWLLVAKRPVVNLRVLADRNFAVGCAMVGCLGFVCSIPPRW